MRKNKISMDKQPLISVIMGVYNAENRVSDCIESIIKQTYRNWEFVICDDCSKDRTYQILKQYQQKDNRIRIIRNEKNMKLAASLNNCLREAKGIYIARMDDDDISIPERFEKQVIFLNENPEYSVVGSNAQISDGQEIIGNRFCKESPSKTDVLFGPPYIHPSIMMRKCVYDQLNGYTVASCTKRGQDWDLWFRFYAAGFKGYNIQEKLIIYHESPEDYKKRTFQTALGYTKIAVNGYKMLKVSGWKYIFTLKPIMSYLIPEILKEKMRHEKL